ncbi:hypothetical protein [Glaciihabitans sp. UYNi722]|uniref:hypothetical protein n=1 Tax=Glaciihabitans sp. UYNi722 TaxID=3156344 RepID=UPI0033929A0A
MDDLVETTLNYTSDGVGYRALLMHPPGNKPTALVVLLPDWQGQSPLAREHAGALAARGCAVAVADLYGDGWSPTDPDQVGRWCRG